MPSKNDVFYHELGEINLGQESTSKGLSFDYTERKLIWIV